jgi:hypothetical protein
MTPYAFPNHQEFRDRERELGALRTWYADAGADPIFIVLGRRRVGKSWLMREFAHGLRADILVCDETLPSNQLQRFAAQLRDSVGVPLALRSAADLFEVLFGLGRQEPYLAIIDEFPNLLGHGGRADSELAAVLEDQLGRSRTKFLLAGSQVMTMDRLLRPRAPLYGRARRLTVPPMSFQQSRPFLEPQHSGPELIERFAIAGGMPRYLQQLGARGTLRASICRAVLDPLSAPLYDEPRTVLSMELTEPTIHFTLLATLARRQQSSLADLTSATGLDRGLLGRYLNVMRELFLVDAAAPMFSTAKQRKHRYRVRDNLMRFWFAYVFPNQGILSSLRDVGPFFDAAIAPHIPEFVSCAFEEVCRDWVRLHFNTEVGSWWGLSLNELRRSRQRTSEEIDVVAGTGGRAVVVGEAKWTNRQMSPQVLTELRDFKIPALEQAQVDTRTAQVVLFSKSGFHPALHAEAVSGRVRLVDLHELLST